MSKSEILKFIQAHPLAVQSSISSDGLPQSAVVGFVINSDFYVFFDTVDSSRKVKNLRTNPAIAFVIGGLIDGDERTVQYEGIADEPEGSELELLKELYFEKFPDGRERRNWKGLIYIRARPTWIRYSDFIKNPPEIIEYNFDQENLDG